VCLAERIWCYRSDVATVERRIPIVMMVLAVVIGIAIASDAPLNRSEPRYRYWSDVMVFGCAEHGEPDRPTFLLTVRP
jgi:hypothetical protein